MPSANKGLFQGNHLILSNYEEVDQQPESYLQWSMSYSGYYQGWGLLSQFSPFRYFPHFPLLSKQTLAIEYHVYIWQVSPQLSCGDTCQIWMWSSESNRYCCKIENFAYGEISERSFSNPHPRSAIELIHKSPNASVYISVLNGALWDMEQVHPGFVKLVYSGALSAMLVHCDSSGDRLPWMKSTGEYSILGSVVAIWVVRWDAGTAVPVMAAGLHAQLLSIICDYINVFILLQF